jgi:glycosyltransferase involved in cell wall biosynthesis
MKVSVIIPNYNHSPYLEQRMDSVLNQTYRDFELIILDDCSTDNSRDVIEKYRGHEKISQIVYNEENSGSTFKQWEKGISLAKGEWIWIAESDDWCELTLLEELMFGSGGKNVKIAFCHSIVTTNGKINYVTYGDYLIQKHEGNDFIQKRMLKGNGLYNASMIVFKKEAIDNKVFEIINTFKFCGDWLFWVFLIKDNAIVEIGKPLNYFRKHNDDVSGKSYLNGLAYSEGLRVYLYLKSEGFIGDYQFKKLVHNMYKTIGNTVEDEIILKTILNEYHLYISRSFRIKRNIFTFINS